MSISKIDYNELLQEVYGKAAVNKELYEKEVAEFKEGLGCYTMEELRSMLKAERLNYFLTEDELYNVRARAVDVEFTKRILKK